jgi:hypothetical protein
MPLPRMGAAHFATLPLDECGEVFRRLALGCDRGGANFFQAFLHSEEIFRPLEALAVNVSRAPRGSPGRQIHKPPETGYEVTPASARDKRERSHRARHAHRP